MKTNKYFDRPWLYPNHPEHQTFVRLLAAAVTRGGGDVSYVVSTANDVMDAMERLRATGGLDKEQVPPKQPRVQPVEGGLPPRHDIPFFRLPDGTLFYRGSFNNLIISQPLNDHEITIQRADVLDMVQATKKEYNIG